MKKPYQIEAQRAVRQLEATAADENPAAQMVLPMAEMSQRRGVVAPQRAVINKGRAAQLAHGKYGDAKRAAHIALPQDSNSSSVNVT